METDLRCRHFNHRRSGHGGQDQTAESRGQRADGAQRYEDVLARSILDFCDREPWIAVANLIPAVAERRSPVSCQAREEDGRTWDVIAHIAAKEGIEDRVVMVVRDITQIIKLRVVAAQRGDGFDGGAGRRSRARGEESSVRHLVHHRCLRGVLRRARRVPRIPFDSRGEVERLRKLMQELLELANRYPSTSFAMVNNGDPTARQSCRPSPQPM